MCIEFLNDRENNRVNELILVANEYCTLISVYGYVRIELNFSKVGVITGIVRTCITSTDEPPVESTCVLRVILTDGKLSH
jgi:hypothetical protein